MSQQQDNFSGGFILGALVGGAIGAVFGVVLANPKAKPPSINLEDPQVPRPRKRPLRVSTESTEQSIEVARQGLESKIAQLNDAIEDVRHQINTVNGKAEVNSDR
jgi:gas vesicle protein